MKNWKIKRKLITGFLITAVLTGLVACIGIYGLITLADHEQSLYYGPASGHSLTQEAAANLQEQRVLMRDLILNIDDTQKVNETIKSMAELEAEFQQLVVDYQVSISYGSEEEQAEELAIMANTMKYYTEDFDAIKREMEAAAETKDVARMTAAQHAAAGPVADTVASLQQAVDFNQAQAEAVIKDDTAQAGRLTLIMGFVSIMVVIIGIVLGLYMAGLIARPTRTLVDAANAIAEGDVEQKLEIHTKDEIGELADSFRNMMRAIRAQSDILQQIADGDYSGSIAVRSEKDVMNKSLNTVIEKNNNMLLEIREAAAQVAAGAGQIATAAQTLATGSGEQAATVEEFSATISEIEQQIQQSAANAGDGYAVTVEAGKLMEGTIHSMGRMTEAMNEIDESSQNITKVIKVIDDIAFQTNILALNAAVEAARAGQHGKGFAVVADEVRNLASKSAEAAKETSALIEGSSRKVQEGNAIVETSNESLASVAQAAEKSAVLMESINNATQQQSGAMAEITMGIGQISDVVQANSATAQQSAAAAEELSAQANMLENILSQFKLRDAGASSGRTWASASGPTVSAPPSVPAEEVVPEIDLGDAFDKY